MRENAFVAGDTGSKLRVTCTDNDTGGAIDLTGKTVNLKWLNSSGTLVTKAMTLVTPASGIAEYQFVTGELFASEMGFEVEIIDGSDVTRSLEVIDVDVREAFA